MTEIVQISLLANSIIVKEIIQPETVGKNIKQISPFLLVTGEDSAASVTFKKWTESLSVMSPFSVKRTVCMFAQVTAICRDKQVLEY